MSYFHRSFPKTNVIQSDGKKGSSYNGPNLSIIYDYGQGDANTPYPCSVNNTSVVPPCGKHNCSCCNCSGGSCGKHNCSCCNCSCGSSGGTCLLYTSDAADE